MASTRDVPAPSWWQDAAIYQVYPRSFADGNGEGVGDLAGLLDRLPYIASLGVDGIWMTPSQPSPQVDQGYDERLLRRRRSALWHHGTARRTAAHRARATDHPRHSREKPQVFSAGTVHGSGTRVASRDKNPVFDFHMVMFIKNY